VSALRAQCRTHAGGDRADASATTAGQPAAISSELPTYPANLEQALATNNDFWLDHAEELEMRFNAWVVR